MIAARIDPPQTDPRQFEGQLAPRHQTAKAPRSDRLGRLQSGPPLLAVLNAEGGGK
jgi:hypothetical protein